MHKLQNGSQVSERPQRKPLVGLGGYFSESNDQGAPSYPGQDWFNDCTDEFINALDEMGITYDQEQLDHLARAFAAVRSQEWNANVNYGIGQEVVRNNLRYIARAASGPDNGGAITPENNSGSTWDLVLPQAYTSSTSDISSKWVKIANVFGSDSLNLDIFGGSDVAIGNRFSCEITISYHEYAAGYVPPFTFLKMKTGGVNDPKFYIVSVSSLQQELWMEVISTTPYPLTISVKNRVRNKQTVAGILSIINTAPTGITLVPYDTGYQ
ncbi:hypothetical protein RUK91_003092, partial [Vibrio cholerae]|nr:hypothetical protein [Vibrio cholerae]